jgi:hypothetical protein
MVNCTEGSPVQIRTATHWLQIDCSMITLLPVLSPKSILPSPWAHWAFISTEKKIRRAFQKSFPFFFYFLKISEVWNFMTRYFVSIVCSCVQNVISRTRQINAYHIAVRNWIRVLPWHNTHTHTHTHIHTHTTHTYTHTHIPTHTHIHIHTHTHTQTQTRPFIYSHIKHKTQCAICMLATVTEVC